MLLKKERGKFFTKNYNYILQNIQIPSNINNIVEPFCGEGDLLEFIEIDNYEIIERYDINPLNENIIERNTLLDPPDYSDKFVLTNPPYLAKNKNKDIVNDLIYKKYNTDDLYKAFLLSIIENPPIGGIIIIPLNFISSIRNCDILLRKLFLNIFDILLINIFEEQVFSDTSYTICSLQFYKKNEQTLDNEIKIFIYPSNKKIKVSLNENNNFMIGGELYSLKESNHIINRLTIDNIEELNTLITVKCIDCNSNNRIRMYMTDIEDVYVDDTPKLSARSFITLIINPILNLYQQKKLVKRFNKFLNNNRKKYNSLFLTNYRESKDIARKRISFGLIYSICRHLLIDIMNEDE